MAVDGGILAELTGDEAAGCRMREIQGAPGVRRSPRT